MKLYKVYVLLDPEDMSIFYVGVTSGSLRSRLSQHTLAVRKIVASHGKDLCPSNMPLRQQLMWDMFTRFNGPIIDCVFATPCRDVALDVEKRLIQSVPFLTQVHHNSPSSRVFV